MEVGLKRLVLAFEGGKCSYCGWVFDKTRAMCFTRLRMDLPNSDPANYLVLCSLCQGPVELYRRRLAGLMTRKPV